MMVNILFWIVISIFVGIVGFKLEVNKSKNLLSNIVAAFFGVFISAFIVHFLIWPDNGFINPVAAIIGIVFGLVAVKLEDNVFLRV
jgi:uncharacterized membrane protein YeaQ/YmgE (transglycosylase-associated protein family)